MDGKKIGKLIYAMNLFMNSFQVELSYFLVEIRFDGKDKTHVDYKHLLSKQVLL